MTRCLSNHPKLIIAVLSALAVSLTVSGCGGGSDSEPDGEQITADTSAGGGDIPANLLDGADTAYVPPTAPEGARLSFGAPLGALASPLQSIASVAFGAYNKLNACLENRKVGQPCVASDSDNIRETLKQIKELRSVIDRNQKELLGEFDSIRQTLLEREWTSFSKELISMVNNTVAAGYAYEALALCATSTEATCRPYIGEANAPPIEISEAIRKTKGYMKEKVELLPIDLPTTVTKFTGSASFRYRDGLAEAIWRYHKSVQDRDAGVTALAVKEAGTVPVLTPKLVNEHNADITYWVDAFSKYTFFRVMRDGLDGDQDAMERRQAEANVYVANAVSRDSVYGAGARYILPSLPSTGVVLVDWADASKQEMKAWVLTDAFARGTGIRRLGANDVDDLVRIASTYAPFSTFAKVSGAMPQGGWYWAWTPVVRKTYSELEINSSGGNQRHGLWTNLNVDLLTTPEDAREWCSTLVKGKANISGALDKEAVRKFEFNINSRPNSDPEIWFSLGDAWDKVGRGKRVTYRWATYELKNTSATQGEKLLGLGTFVTCQDVNPGSHIQLLKVPALMSPV